MNFQIRSRCRDLCSVIILCLQVYGLNAADTERTSASLVRLLHAPPLRQARQTPGLTLEQALSDAIERNPVLETARQEWLASRAQIQQAGALDDPKFMIGYEFALDPFGRREMPLDMKKWTADRVMMGFSWMISPAKKRRQRTQRAIYEAATAAARYRATFFEVRRKAAQAYAEVYYATENCRIARENVEILKHIYEVALHRFHASEMTKTELTKLEI